MADNVVINLEVNAAGAVQNIDAVESAIVETSEATKSLKAQLRALQVEMQDLDPNSARFQELSKQAGELKDTILDTAEAIKNNAGNAFEGLSNNAQTLGSRLLAMDFSGVGNSAKAMAGNVKNINFKLVTEEIGGMIKGFASLGKALFANPIFLIAAAVAGIIMNFDKLREVIAFTYRDETKALEAATANVNAQQEKLDAISSQENTLRLQGKSERDILKMKIAQTEEVINATKQQIEQQKIVLQSQIAAEARAKSILAGIMQFISSPLQFVAASIDSIGEGLKKVGVISESFGLQDMLNKGINGLADMVFSPDKMKSNGEAQLAEMDKQLKALENSKAGSIMALRAMDKKDADERKAAREKEMEEQAQLERDRNKSIVEMQSRSATMLKNEFDTGLKMIDMQARTQAAMTENLKLEEQKRQKIRETNMQFAKDNMVNGLEFLANVTTIFEGKSRKEQEKAFKVRKAISIAQTLISTYQGAMQAYNSQIVPLDPSSVVRGAIAAAFVVATGLANVKKIASQKFDGGGATGGGSPGGAPSLGGGGSMAGGTPTFNPVDMSFINNRPAQGAQTYVLAGSVSNAQDANAKIQDLRRL
jgi:uncharacterized coiled-coil protein SlyX